jgi:NAD(P)-dependent dehydrogenase (short-subunit alcohol dehydrogenase family)
MVRKDAAVLVTGGNSGIGLECARQLAQAGLRVVIASRNRDASAEAVGRIVYESGNEAVEELELDLGALGSVRQLAKEIEARRLPLRAVVCNAGLQVTRGPMLSPEGFERTFAVNHLGHFLLVNLLLHNLLENAPSRVVIVSSGVHDPAQKTGMPKPSAQNLEVLARTGGAEGARWSGRLAYVNSKLCNLWFAYELIRRVEAAGLGGDERPLSVNAFEPGLVPGSGLARDYPPALRFVWDRVLPLLTPLVSTINTAARSGAALARVVTDPGLERVSGRYFASHTGFAEAVSSNESYDVERAAGLWDRSVAWTGLSPEESPLVAPLAKS